VNLDLVTIVVSDYDTAIDFFVRVLGLDLIEDSPSLTGSGRAKRWVVVRPANATTGILLARADGETQESRVGDQAGDRVGFFLRVDDFNGTLERLKSEGIDLLTTPREEPYGRVVVFRDIFGNRWDLLG
jgi:catechol 2,3-dioxygenase-like lactoylglutathione lyase family enzyme